MSPVTTTRSLLIRAGLIGFAGLAAIGGSATLAKHEDLTFPAAIHAGTCEAPGDEVLALGELVRLPEDSEGERAGAPGSQVVHGLPDDSSIELTVDDLFAADHILAVFNPDGDIVACGPIGAYSYDEGDDLVFGLRSQGESPYSAVAIMTPNEEDGLDAEIYLVNNTPAPAATPAAGTDTGTGTTDDDASDTGTPDADDDLTEDADEAGDEDTEDGDDATPEA